MKEKNRIFQDDTYCLGEWCNVKEDLLGDIPRDPFKTVKACDELSHSLNPGRVLSVNLSIACTPDYLSYYHSMEGLIQILEGVFPSDDEVLLNDLLHSKVMMTFGTNPIQGFSIGLLTIKLDFFPDSDCCNLDRLEEHLTTITPRICGYMCETEYKYLYSIEEIRGYLYLRMTSQVSYRFTAEFRELLTRTDMLRWDWYIQSSPTVFYGESLIDFRNSVAGQSMLQTDNNLDKILTNWGQV